MAKNNKKRIKQEKYTSTSDAEEIKKFLIILGIIILVIVLIYLFTRIFVTKDLFKKDEYQYPTVEGSINYSTTLIGSMLNINDDEYYVMIANSDNSEYSYYISLLSTYTYQNLEHLNVYVADLDNELNKRYIAEKNNITSDIANFKVSGPTLIKIKDKKITASYDTKEEISQVLKHIPSEEE